MMGFRRWIVCGGTLGKQTGTKISLTVLYVLIFYIHSLILKISFPSNLRLKKVTL